MGRPKTLPEAVSPKLAADVLGVSIKTIRRWIYSGRMVAYRVGPLLVRIPRSEISRFRTYAIANPSEDGRRRVQPPPHI